MWRIVVLGSSAQDPFVYTFAAKLVESIFEKEISVAVTDFSGKDLASSAQIIEAMNFVSLHMQKFRDFFVFTADYKEKMLDKNKFAAYGKLILAILKEENSGLSDKEITAKTWMILQYSKNPRFYREIFSLHASVLRAGKAVDILDFTQTKEANLQGTALEVEHARLTALAQEITQIVPNQLPRGGVFVAIVKGHQVQALCARLSKHFASESILGACLYSLSTPYPTEQLEHTIKCLQKKEPADIQALYKKVPLRVFEERAHMPHSFMKKCQGFFDKIIAESSMIRPAPAWVIGYKGSTEKSVGSATPEASPSARATEKRRPFT